MTWQLLNVEPMFGVCDLCKKDTCGIVDGQHMWVRLNNVTDKYEDPAVIGYKCIKEMADNLGFTKPDEVVKEVVRPPTDEEIGAYLHEMFVDADFYERLNARGTFKLTTPIEVRLGDTSSTNAYNAAVPVDSVPRPRGGQRARQTPTSAK